MLSQLKKRITGILTEDFCKIINFSSRIPNSIPWKSLGSEKDSLETSGWIIGNVYSAAITVHTTYVYINTCTPLPHKVRKCFVNISLQIPHYFPNSISRLAFYKRDSEFDFCLTVHHQLGKVIQMNQLDATMIYWLYINYQLDALTIIYS